MNRIHLIEKAVSELQKLPETKLREAADFIEFLLAKSDDRVISKGIHELAAQSKSFDFLNDEEELYSLDDVKHRNT